MAKNTAKDVLLKLDQIKPTLHTAQADVQKFTGSESLEQVLMFHNHGLDIKRAIDSVTPVVLNIQRPLPDSDVADMMNRSRSLVGDITSLVDQLIVKKPSIASLQVGNLHGLLAQTMKEIQASMKKLGNAFVEATSTPERAADAKKLSDEIVGIIQKTIDVYQ